MKTLWRDLRYSVRSWRKSPGMAAAALLNLALGIGAGLTIFAWINATVLGLNPLPEPERAAYLWSTDRQGGNDRVSVSRADFLALREQSRSFERLAAFESVRRTLGGDPPERIHGLAVSSDFFAVSGGRPLLGRTFLAGEDSGGAHLVILSHALWQERFDGDRGLVGRTLPLDGEPYTVIGVMPDSFWFPSQRVKLWTLLDLRPATLEREPGAATVVGLLRTGATLGEARAEIEVLAHRLEQSHPGSHAGRGARVVPLSWELLDRGTRTVLFLLAIVILVVLLIACANVANLLLARGLSRQGELALRVALGAGRGRLVRQLLTDSLVLGLAGGALGLLVARWGAGILLAAIPRTTPDPESILDGRVLGAALLLTLMATVLSGLVPALRVSRSDPRRALQETVTGAGRGPGSRRLFKTLVVAEVTVALVLLAAAGLLIRTLAHLHRMDVGFEPRRVLTLRLDLPADRYPSPARVAGFYEQALERIGSLPATRAAGATSHLPFVSGAPGTSFTIEGRAPGPESPRAHHAAVTPGYFATLEIPVLRGRGFTAKDGPGSLPVAVINETLARQHWPGGNPLGQRIRLEALADPEKQDRWWTIVGVLRDARTVHPAFEPTPQVYVPHAQSPLPDMALVVRAADHPAAQTGGVRARIFELDRQVAVYDVQELRQRMSDLMNMPRAFAGLLATFAGLALILAATGVFAVTAYSVSRRTHEIGVRMALGARPRDVRRMVVREGARLVALGALFGSVLAFLVGQVMSGILYGVGAADPVSFGGGIALLAVAGILASWLPARRAVGVLPMEALRFE